MSELVRFEGPAGSELVVEVADDTPGLELISRREDGIVDARRRIHESLESALPTLRSVVEAASALAPQEMEIDFGMKFTAEAGVVVAKAATEGHLTVRLRWTRPESAAARPAGPEN
ncbi:hypothetical protein OEB94_17560 [Streptomyces sp. ICN988]|uniref:CU044_2847 family protein n=1 Tax=unclassified Streptomyces TaxID=2593676 RepID=UPI0021E48118|nr:CU044_2847 family protein [Streptomyces sp. ICN988]MCV2461091.1 hypothetical protein [Streptomyces sp. ICN988]